MLVMHTRGFNAHRGLAMLTNYVIQTRSGYNATKDEHEMMSDDHHDQICDWWLNHLECNK